MKSQSFARRLKTARVHCETERPLVLRCNECGAAWSPDILSGGHLRRFWFRCRNGCNRPEV